jgi:hypothetical protein
MQTYIHPRMYSCLLFAYFLRVGVCQCAFQHRFHVNLYRIYSWSVICFGDFNIKRLHCDLFFTICKVMMPV